MANKDFQLSDHAQAPFTVPGAGSAAFTPPPGFVLRPADSPGTDPALRWADEGPASFTPEEIRAGQKAVIRLFDRWGLTTQQAVTLLGGISPRTFQRWKKGLYGRVSQDTALRMSHLLGVHHALWVIFDEPGRHFGWIKRPNGRFGGRSALDVMLEGGLDAVIRMRRYLDAETAIW